MKIIKGYCNSVCIVYTILVLTKIILEGIFELKDSYYIMNFVVLFVITCFATFVLYLHRIFHNVPLLFIMVAQYVIVIAAIMGGIRLLSMFTDVSDNAYRDMLIQVSLPYAVFAIIYYVNYFREVKCANENLKAINRE